ncbi:MAG: class I SAM-dependent methyltransferase [Planctomycetota bacterium]|nr:class I SAM-dependent methyltransferase [Planctomycetota bacterium]
MEILTGSLYDYPKYYDLVFGSDCQSELEFLNGTFEKYAKRKVKKLFEPACGTGRLLIRLAQQEFQVSGLDLNPHAVDFCNQRLVKRGFPAGAFVGDMADFQLKKRVDAGFNLINSFRHLASDAQALSHLECMAASISKGGLYLLAMHLSPTKGDPIETESWSARRGNLAVNTHMWIINRDTKKRNEHIGITFDIYTPLRHFKINDTMDYRTYTAKQMEKLIARAPNWEIVGVHDFTYDIDEQIDIGPETEDVVYVLRKR